MNGSTNPIRTGVSPLALMMKGDVICAAAITALDFRIVRRSIDQRCCELAMRSSGKVIASCLTAFSDAFREPSLTTWSAFANRGHCDLRLTPLKNPSMGWLANGGSRLLVRRAARAEQIDLFIDKSLADDG